MYLSNRRRSTWPCRGTLRPILGASRESQARGARVTIPYRHIHGCRAGQPHKHVHVSHACDAHVFTPPPSVHVFRSRSVRERTEVSLLLTDGAGAVRGTRARRRPNLRGPRTLNFTERPHGLFGLGLSCCQPSFSHIIVQLAFGYLLLNQLICWMILPWKCSSIQSGLREKSTDKYRVCAPNSSSNNGTIRGFRLESILVFSGVTLPRTKGSPRIS